MSWVVGYARAWLYDRFSNRWSSSNPKRCRKVVDIDRQRTRPAGDIVEVRSGGVTSLDPAGPERRWPEKRENTPHLLKQVVEIDGFLED